MSEPEIIIETLLREDREEPLSIANLVYISHETAKAKGWWQDWDRNIPEQLALMHSEISEALEEYRKGRPVTDVYDNHNGKRPNCSPPNAKPEGFGIELADCIIRIADTCGRYGIDMEQCLLEKLRYNLTRPQRHGGKKA